jgi:hypothetical protein
VRHSVKRRHRSGVALRLGSYFFSFNFVTRRKGEFYGTLDRQTINTIVQAIFPWLQQMGATMAYDPQTVIDYNEEGAVSRINAPRNPIILAAIIPNQRPIAARVLRNNDPAIVASKALTKPLQKVQKPAAQSIRRSIRKRARKPKRFRDNTDTDEEM